MAQITASLKRYGSRPASIGQRPSRLCDGRTGHLVACGRDRKVNVGRSLELPNAVRGGIIVLRLRHAHELGKREARSVLVSRLTRRVRFVSLRLKPVNL
jgi:hypothetical protein